uniref:Uncharacterized protein n=1 Tax=Rhizophora mucronata TaxID=61149 RepID=A0A2P2QRF5_RHIMU
MGLLFLITSRMGLFL